MPSGKTIWRKTFASAEQIRIAAAGGTMCRCIIILGTEGAGVHATWRLCGQCTLPGGCAGARYLMAVRPVHAIWWLCCRGVAPLRPVMENVALQASSGNTWHTWRHVATSWSSRPFYGLFGSGLDWDGGLCAGSSAGTTPDGLFPTPCAAEFILFPWVIGIGPGAELAW